MNEAPPERRQTVRDALRERLRGDTWWTSLDLSAAVGVSEKAIPDHLEHLRKSLPGVGDVLEVEVARCLGCNFLFEGRERLSKPSRCPKCRVERIEPPRFRIRGAERTQS